MPVYQYNCTSCEHHFDEVKKISEYDLPCKSPCPECGMVTVQRYIGSAPSFSKTGCRTHLKTDSGFQSVLNKMKKFYKGNTIETN